MIFAPLILTHLGAKCVRMTDWIKDPECEDDFLKLDYDSDIQYTWEQYLEKKDIVMIKIGIKQIRQYRAKLLSDCDWIMTVDNVERIANIEEWKQYRTMLRDLPEQSIQFIWKENNLDFQKMDLPLKPDIIKK